MSATAPSSTFPGLPVVPPEDPSLNAKPNQTVPRAINKVFLAVEQSEGAGARGSVDHEDFAGNKGTIETGDLQFMTAGRGIVHAEMPHQNTDGSANVGIQLWVDLPQRLKMCEPRYRDLRASEIPSVDIDDGKVHIKVISGQSHGVDSVKELAYTPVWLLDINMKPGGKITQNLPVGWNAFAYTLQGSTLFGAKQSQQPVAQYHNVVFEQKGDTVIAEVSEDATEDSRFILVAGLPLDQKVIQYGP
ncbi:RNA pol II transcription cofactor, partial [Cryomyces antarcticus]